MIVRMGSNPERRISVMDVPRGLARIVTADSLTTLLISKFHARKSPTRENVGIVCATLHKLLPGHGGCTRVASRAPVLLGDDPSLPVKFVLVHDDITTVIRELLITMACNEHLTTASIGDLPRLPVEPMPVHFDLAIVILKVQALMALDVYSS